jgi:carboxylesterase type B
MEFLLFGIMCPAYRRIVRLFLLFLSSQTCLVIRAQESDDTLSVRSVTVTIPSAGRILGKRLSGGLDFFGGIPYAAPPVGALRWAPPEPVTPWAPSQLDATQFGPDCWQLVDPVLNPGAETQQMSEDCLYLNVYTPAGAHAAVASRNPLRPVLVWLHGGAFQQGGARRPEYDGRRLADRGTIVVTLNYRLGALGFLVSSSDGLYGNFGLMDQRAALHWIKENIIHFGGDPDNVTLFGESAGAVMTVLHLMMEHYRDKKDELTVTNDKNDKSNRNRRLFHKAIIQSNPLGLQFRSIVVADFIGEALKVRCIPFLFISL